MDQNFEARLREELEKEIRQRMTAREKIRGAVLDILTIIFILLAIVGIFSLLNKWFSDDKNKDQVSINDVVVPVDTTNNGVNNQQQLSEHQISGEYILTQGMNPYDNFFNNSLAIALNGSFKRATISVNGQILDNNPRLISFALGNTSGTLNGVRKSENFLDEQATQDKGGLFQNDFKFDIDLFSDTFVSTSKNEFLQTRQLTKPVKFWDEIIPPPPTTLRLLVAPFDKSGVYGNVLIKSIMFKYQCDGQCQVSNCQNGEKTTVCLTRNFGKTAAQLWCERTKAEGCKNL